MDALAELLGDSPTMEMVRDRLHRLLDRQQAGQRLPPVLLQGETGTGKGLIARLLHRHGARRDAPFVDVNCAAIPETLLEAELFGFERGAFTDARRAKPGLLHAAHDGVLFLDEVALLPDSMQAKLLTAIEERAVRRLGSTRREPADVWVISATNADLAAAVRARRFREDLYHRLAVFILDLPPLRDRSRDILLLAERFLARACAEYGLPPRRLDPAAQARLLAYAWPGNIRELGNVMERAALLTDAPVVTSDSLGLLHVDGVEAAPGSPSGTATDREEVQRRKLEAALEQTGWNISLTAARLNIARNTVYARLARYGLRPQPPRTAAADALPCANMAAAPLSRDTRLLWERRSLALLRADLRSRDAVDTWSEQSRALDAIIAKVQSFGGRVEEVTPTGLVAAFGLEPAEDAGRRAAHAAMAIHKDAQRARASHGAGPHITIALHVAPLLIRRVGERIEIDASAKRAEWSVLDQLMHGKEPDDTIASVAAAPFLERRFELTRVDGADSLEPVYRLTGQERRGLGLWGAMTRFVGRDEELNVLRSRLALAERGRGQVVAIVGEAGVGKSRLMYELAPAQRLPGWRMLEGTTVSYAQAMSYLPVIGLLRGYFAAQERDDEREVRDKVTSKLLTLDTALQPVLPALLALLDVPVDDAAWRRLDPSARRQRTLEAVRRLLLREAREQPLLVIVEDLHWIDGETQAVLDSLVEVLGSTRLYLLVSYRPGYQHAWGGKTSYSELRLDVLPSERTREFLDALLGEDSDLTPLKQLLVKRGNPFFLEETVRTLVEKHALVGARGGYRLTRAVPALQIPPTVEAVLAARIDRLAPEDRRLLQTAAVIGKDVPVALLQAIADLDDLALREGLARLQAAEFLYEDPLSREAQYTFKHALTHEVTYGGLVPERRRELHARIVEALQRLYPDRVAEQIEQLAHHAFNGEMWEPAVQYLRQAGTKAAERYALREANTWFDQALKALARLPENRATLEEVVDIRLGRHLVLTILGDYRVVHENLNETERLAEQLGDDRQRGQVYRAKVNLHNHVGQTDDALAWSVRALEIADRLGDRFLRRYTTTNLEQTRYMRGEFEQVINLAWANLRELLADAVYARPGGFIPTSVYDRGWLVRGLVELGRFAEAAEPAEAAIQIAERTQHPYAIGWACMCAGNLHSWKGDWGTARSLYERSIEVFREAGVVTTLNNVTANSSWVLACLGDAEALTRAREGERLLELSRVQQRIAGNSYSYIWLCHAYLRLRQVADAERVVERVLEPPIAWAEAFACHLRGEIAAHPDRWLPETAESCYHRALALAEPRGMRPLVAHCHLGLGKLYRRAGKREQAHEHLTTAMAMYREMDMRYWSDQAEAELAEAR